MPEAPDLEVIKDFLNQRVRGDSIEAAQVVRPTVLRSLTGVFSEDIPGHHIVQLDRKGKLLLMELSDGRWLAINPMLTGALQYCTNQDKLLKKTCFVLHLPQGRELRYLDDRQMGRVYYTNEEQLSKVPRLFDQGPDVLDSISHEEFQERLRKFHGEIKGVLTRGAFISGIGNAYSDEILFAAGIYPFRKSRTLNQQEIQRLHDHSKTVVMEAIAVLEERMGDNIHIKIRDFLKVHNKGGQPCPSCGNNITQLTANQRITSYCRRCQPGMLLKN